jgi:hypothetical protein
LLVTNLGDNDPLRQLDPDWQSVPVGASVIASDGRTIGKVDAKRADGLHVKGSDSSEYLVPPTDIASIGPEGVRLVVSSQQTIRAQADADAPGGMITDQAAGGPA